MLAGPPERLLDALGLLDPAHRALLELSLRREVADPALAELLNTDVDTVVRQRAEALDRLAEVVEAPPSEVEEALIAHWRGEAEAEQTEAGAAEDEAGAEEAAVEDAEEEAEEEEPPEPEPEPEEPWSPGDAVKPGEAEPRRRRGLWLAVTVLAATGLVLILALSGGGDDDEPPEQGASTTPRTTDSPPPPPPDGGDEPVELESVVGGDAGGTARIVESGGAARLELRLRGLGPGRHEVWLYNSIGDARRLATADGPAPFVRAPLPEGYERYRFVDVSQEPDDGNPNHSGASVLRVPVAELPGA